MSLLPLLPVTVVRRRYGGSCRDERSTSAFAGGTARNHDILRYCRQGIKHGTLRITKKECQALACDIPSISQLSY